MAYWGLVKRGRGVLGYGLIRKERSRSIGVEEFVKRGRGVLGSGLVHKDGTRTTTIWISS